MFRDALRYGLIGLAAWLMLPSAAVGEDDQAGMRLSPSEAAGRWTLQSGGAEICALTLKPSRSGAGDFGMDPGSCGDALPRGASGWLPTDNGMAITDGRGRRLLPFDRWSNSLFVSHRSSGMDLQLRRGDPGQR